MTLHPFTLIGMLLIGLACGTSNAVAQQPTALKPNAQERVLETATFGGGCYWCVEAIFQRVQGVEQVAPGFMGGHLDNPTYEQVLTGRSGHVEVIQIQYDPTVITFGKLLEIFWKTHDPTTINRQGPDAGPQYRSVVFYHSDQQKAEATKYKRELNRTKTFTSPVVTAIEKASQFYQAKEDHRDYYNRNPEQQYCQLIIGPKLKKLNEVFGDQLKPVDPPGTAVEASGTDKE